MWQHVFITICQKQFSVRFKSSYFTCYNMIFLFLHLFLFHEEKKLRNKYETAFHANELFFHLVVGTGSFGVCNAVSYLFAYCTHSTEHICISVKFIRFDNDKNMFEIYNSFFPLVRFSYIYCVSKQNFQV